MKPRELILQALNGIRTRPVPWGDHGIDASVLERAFGVTFPPLEGDSPDLNYFLSIIERQKFMNEITGGYALALPRYFTMAPRIRNADNSGVLTDERSLLKLSEAFVPLDTHHWDMLKRVVDTKGDYAMFGSISTGIGHVWQTMDLMAFSVAIVDNPGLLRSILTMYTDWTCQVCEKCNTIGIDFMWSFDDFAFKTGTVYSPDVFRDIVLPYARQVADAIKMPWVFHSDGNYMIVLDDLLSLGMNALNPIEPGNLDIPAIRKRYPDLTLIGNIDVDILARGTPEEAAADVDRCFRELAETGPYIFASSNSIPDYCKPENVRAAIDRFLEVRGK